jgi:hypothetical protein
MLAIHCYTIVIIGVKSDGELTAVRAMLHRMFSDPDSKCMVQCHTRTLSEEGKTDKSNQRCRRAIRATLSDEEKQEIADRRILKRALAQQARADKIRLGFYSKGAWLGKSIYCL